MGLPRPGKTLPLGKIKRVFTKKPAFIQAGFLLHFLPKLGTLFPMFPAHNKSKEWPHILAFPPGAKHPLTAKRVRRTPFRNDIGHYEWPGPTQNKNGGRDFPVRRFKSAFASRYLPAPQHFLYFLPLPHGHGSLRPILGPSCTTVSTLVTVPPDISAFSSAS